jgi:hypothetical protein
VELLSTTIAAVVVTTSHLAYSLPALAVFQATECIVALIALDVVILAEGALAYSASKDLLIVEHSTRLRAPCYSAFLTEVLQALRTSHTPHQSVGGGHMVREWLSEEGPADAYVALKTGLNPVLGC